MGIAYSGKTILYTMLRCDTSANLRGDIDAAFAAVGITTKTSVTNGYKYTLTSPQGLACKVQIDDKGETINNGGVFTNVIDIQFLSLDESLVGFKHQLIYGPSAYSSIGYEIVVGICQFFIALKGIADQTALPGFGLNRNYSVAGGIPYVAAQVAGTECALSGGSGPGVTQIFWSCGMQDDNYDFRNARLCSTSYCYCLNSTIFVQPMNPASGDTAYTGGLRLYPLTPTMNVDNSFGRWPRVVKYSSQAPLYVDAFVGWSFAVQGQIWDALLATRDETLDSTIQSTQTDAAGNMIISTWVAWNHLVHDIAGIDFSDSGTYFATLYLLIAKPLTKGKFNLAY